MNEPLISVIIPAYNVAPYIRQAVESVLSQTYRQLEVLVIDDGSTDDTAVVLQELVAGDSRLSLIKQVNQGAAAARNAGLDRAIGDYVSFVDADDWLPPTAISDLYDAAVKARSLAAVGAVVYVDNEGRETCRSVSQAVWTTEEMIVNMYTRHVEFVTNGGKLFHQSLFDQLRFPQGRRFEDAFLLPKLYARAEQIAVVASPVYYYCNQREGNTVTGTIDLRYLDRLDALKEVYETYQDNPDLSKVVLNRLFQAKEALWRRSIREKQWEVCRAIEGLYWDEQLQLSEEEKRKYRQVYRQLRKQGFWKSLLFWRQKLSLKLHL